MPSDRRPDYHQRAVQFACGGTEEARDDLITEYQVNKRKSLREMERRALKHLTPFFEGRLMSDIDATDIRRYIAHRQGQTEIVKAAYDFKRKDGTIIRIPEKRWKIDAVSNGEINRELSILKRMFSLLIEAGKLRHRPHIPMLKEAKPRQDFLEPEQLDAVLGHLPDYARPIAEFAAITSWRNVAEILPLEWRRVDFAAGEVRLDHGTTKNGEGRVFPMTAELRVLLERLRGQKEERERKGQIVPWVFVRMVAKGRGGLKEPKPIKSWSKAWKSACRKAGCPGMRPHDLRRTAVRDFDRAGIPRGVAMALSGHKSESVFERYNITSRNDLDVAARALDEARARRKA